MPEQPNANVYNELFPRADSGAGEGKVSIEEMIGCAQRDERNHLLRPED